ncbi:MAG: glycine cleavage system aminomethyltransferase GcvT [Actinomycetota bacterium]
MKTSPLDAQHHALGAKMAQFAGWNMPISYNGTVAEHTAVRSDVGVFDVSHLGKILVRGPNAASLLDRALTNSISTMPVRSARYTLMLDENAGIVDDMIVYAMHPHEFLVVPNASNVDEIERRLKTIEGAASIEIRQLNDAILALQGPRSVEILEKIIGHVEPLDYMHIADTPPYRIARSGYTGEHGYEIFVASLEAPALWSSIIGAGVTPCGLGARDTLRLEMGYPLHGNDIDRSTRPDEAGLMWSVAKSKAEFEGKHALESGAPTKKLVGIKMTDRAIPRHGCPVIAPSGDKIGVVTSGTFSPTLKIGIGLAYVKPELSASGPEVIIDVRGKHGHATVSKPPFVSSNPRD